jgi:ferritin
MLSEKMNEALNVQANRELYSSYLYLSMSYHFESINMKGFAHWMRLQAGEELVHTMKMLDPSSTGPHHYRPSSMFGITSVW